LQVQRVRFGSAPELAGDEHGVWPVAAVVDGDGGFPDRFVARLVEVAGVHDVDQLDQHVRRGERGPEDCALGVDVVGVHAATPLVSKTPAAGWCSSKRLSAPTARAPKPCMDSGMDDRFCAWLIPMKAKSRRSTIASDLR